MRLVTVLCLSQPAAPGFVLQCLPYAAGRPGPAPLRSTRGGLSYSLTPLSRRGGALARAPPSLHTLACPALAPASRRAVQVVNGRPPLLSCSLPFPLPLSPLPPPHLRLGMPYQLSGSLMAKWYRSIRVVTTDEPLGAWLARRGVAVGYWLCVRPCVGPCVSPCVGPCTEGGCVGGWVVGRVSQKWEP
jgi:hypothetical protein